MAGAKAEVLKTLPNAVCKKHQFRSIIGYIVYRTKNDAAQDRMGFTSASTAVEAWEKAAARLKRPVTA